MIPGIIPIPYTSGCPVNTKGCTSWRCPNTCFCEDHCSFEKCALEIPPDECLENIESNWIWSSEDQYWIAQMKGIIFTWWSMMSFGIAELASFYTCNFKVLSTQLFRIHQVVDIFKGNCFAVKTHQQVSIVTNSTVNSNVAPIVGV